MEDDINLQYEKIFGMELRKNIFSSGDEDYALFRKSIIAADCEYNYSDELPFADFEDNCQKKTHAEPLFFIRANGIVAFGYYREIDGCFFILKGSRVSIDESSNYMGTRSSMKRERFLSAVCSEQDDYYIVTKNARCFDATVAACYVLGDDVTFDVWRDIHGRGLEYYYYVGKNWLMLEE